jgi:oligopeptide/dipeptide ABC transporter ATP-binding protein
MTSEELLKVDELTKYYIADGTFALRGGRKVVHALDHVSFDLGQSETLGILGESGSGKTTLGRTILLLTPPTSGTVTVLGKELTSLSRSELRAMRRHTGFVFQDPLSSLDPRMTVHDIIAEPLEIQDYPENEIAELVKSSANEVKLSDRELERYPHQLSGGQRQRVGIARVIVSRPELVILDEPTSSLDISVQAQILNLLLDLQASLKLSFLFISHNVSVIRYMSDRIGVMYRGRIVEIGRAASVIGTPLHPYTSLLIDSIPQFSKRSEFRERAPGRAELEEGAGWVEECAFNKRCPYAQERCRKEEPLLREVDEGHFVACHFAPIT